MFSGRVQLATTVGTSMQPSIHTGDVAVVTHVGRYAVGDVVAYRSRVAGRAVLHRVMWTDGRSYRLKGDNNAAADPEVVTRSQIVGRSVWLFHAAPPLVPAVAAVLALVLVLVWLPSGVAAPTLVAAFS